MLHSPERKRVHMALRELEVEELGKTFSQASIRLPPIQNQITKVRRQNNLQVCSSHEMKKGNGDPLGLLCEDEELAKTFSQASIRLPPIGNQITKVRRQNNLQVCSSHEMKKGNGDPLGLLCEDQELEKTFSQASIKLPPIQSQISSKVRGQNNSQVWSSHEMKTGNDDPLGLLCEDEENDSSSVPSRYASYIPQAGFLNKYQRSANNDRGSKLYKSEYLRMSPPQKDDQRQIYRVGMPEQQRSIPRFSRYYHDAVSGPQCSHHQGGCQEDLTSQASEDSSVSTKSRQPKESRGSPPGPGQASNRRYSYQQTDDPSCTRYEGQYRNQISGGTTTLYRPPWQYQQQRNIASKSVERKNRQEGCPIPFQVAAIRRNGVVDGPGLLNRNLQCQRSSSVDVHHTSRHQICRDRHGDGKRRIGVCLETDQCREYRVHRRVLAKRF